MPVSASPVPPGAEILVTGLARNCAEKLPVNLGRLRRAVTSFSRAHFLVIESDSTDGTVARLEGLARENQSFRFASLGQLAPTHPKRTDRIAVCRNRYLHELRTNPLYRAVTHVLVTDLDGVSRDITAAAVDSCWRPGSPPWDVCTANQSDYYYDIWALRHSVWCPGDAWHAHDALAPMVGEKAAKEIAITSKMIHINPRRAMIEVDSAFGGLAIYRREAFGTAAYAGLDEHGAEICEHVVLHARLRAAGRRIFINPALINAHRTDNSAGKRLPQRLRKRLGDLLHGERDI